MTKRTSLDKFLALATRRRRSYGLPGVRAEMILRGTNTILVICFSAAWGKVSAASLHRKLTRPHLDQVGLFLGCVSCHSSAEVFFLLNFLVVEGSCEVFGLEDLANLYVGLAYVGTALDPLDGFFERLD